MSYNDYWHGDCWMAKYYREAYRKKLEQRNNDMWLQGLYIYEAICNASPILNPMSKKHEPIPYREAPIPITEAQSMRQKKEAEKKQMEHDKEIMKQRMIAINERLKGKEVDNGRRTD